MPQQDKEKCDMLNIQRQALARNIARQTEQNHRLETAVPGLVLVRYEAPTQPASCMYEPTICLVAQGAKRVMLGGEEYLYDANHYLISSVGLPVVANVVEASPEVPLLGMVLKLDMRMLAQMMVDSNLPVTRAAKSGRGMRVSEVCMPLLNAFQRLLDLHDHPQDIAVLSPLIHKEILYRLLLGEQGQRPIDALLGNMGAIWNNLRLAQANPAVIPRNHVVEQALAAAHKDDLGPFDRLLAALVPVVTLVLALIVGLVILAVLSPIYDLASVVG